MKKKFVEIESRVLEIIANERAITNQLQTAEGIEELRTELAELLRVLYKSKVNKQLSLDEEMRSFKVVKPTILGLLMFVETIEFQYSHKDHIIDRCFSSEELSSTPAHIIHDYDQYKSRALFYELLNNYADEQQYNFNLIDSDESNDDDVGTYNGDEHLVWSATQNAAVELGYALFASGALNNGNATLKRIMYTIERVFNTKLGNFYHTYGFIRGRKKDRTAFLNDLRNKLEQKMALDDSKKPSK
ncbi:MAG: RteC domain-containing protein [Rikenellaceae bacterium]